MGQMGFFDVENRYAALDARNDPLVKINAVVPWEAFRSRLESVWRKPPDERKSNAGRQPWDAIVVTKTSTSSAVSYPRPGLTSRPSVGKRTGMRVGQRSTARATTATRTPSPLTVGTN